MIMKMGTFRKFLLVHEDMPPSSSLEKYRFLYRFLLTKI